MESILNSKNNNKTKILQPKNGEKYKHILLAEKNASENIKLKKASLQNHTNAIIKLQKLLKLKNLPNRIEVYDNSHTFGKESVGVMIVVDSEGLSPKNYRKFNIRYNQSKKQLSYVDDYYMMNEVLNRRLKIKQNITHTLPDIIIIDGGRGQFNTVEKILNNKKFNQISLISVSKGRNRNAGREIIHLKNRNINLPPNDPLLFFIQRIRDEAHRFAITTHRPRRAKKSFESIFGELSGIGIKRKKLLMTHFGSIEKIKNASKNELLSINGIPKNVINKLYDFFHSQ